jgi:hypothetical protein
MPDKAKAKPITYAQILAALQASGDMPPAQWVPQQPQNPGYAYETPDPMAQAAHLAQRQQAAAQLGSPVSPVLEIPADAVNAAQKLSPIDQILTYWRSLKRK